MDTTPAITSAETYRWDTVFALRVADVNKAIIAAKTTPPDFQYTSDDGWQIQATFDDWQMTTGGDGKLVKFTLPIRSGSWTMNSKTIQFANIAALIELELAYYDSTTHPPAADGSTFHDLKVKTQQGQAGDKVATVLSIDMKDNNPSLALEAFMPDSLEKWLNQHLDIFDHIFATVNLGNFVANGQFSWVKPTAVDYAFMSKDDVDDSVLGVLCMTENRPYDGLTAQLSPNAIPPGQRAGYLISNERFLTKLLQPAAPYILAGLKSTDLAISSDQRSLELINPNGLSIPVDYKDPTSGEVTTYQNVLQKLVITTEDTYVKVYFLTATDIGWGATAHCESTHVFQIQVKQKSNGKPTLIYTEPEKIPANHWYTNDTPVVLQVIEVIFAAIATVILGVFTDGAGFVIGAIIIGLLTGLMMTAPDIAGMIGQDDAPDLDLLVLNCSDPIVWTGQDKFQLNSASVNGCLQLGGLFIPTTNHEGQREDIQAA